MNNRILVANNWQQKTKDADDKEPVSLIHVGTEELVEGFVRALRERLVVKFSYVKKDGSIKEAVGSWSPKLIPQAEQPKSWAEGKMERDEVLEASTLNYYDLEAMGWRKVTLDNLLTVEV